MTRKTTPLAAAAALWLALAGGATLTVSGRQNQQPNNPPGNTSRTPQPTPKTGTGAAAPQPATTQPATTQSATTQSATTQPAAKADYKSLLDRLKKGDRSVDFAALRMAYAETPEYSPYGFATPDREAMFAALREEKFEKALEHAGRILDKNFVEANAHFVSALVHRELGDTERADFHHFVFGKLLDSIRNSGDGKTPATAFVVISTDEEYILLRVLGLRPSGQSLINDKGHNYDLMRAVDPKTNETVQYYFNIDKPFGWLGNSLKKKN